MSNNRSDAAKYLVFLLILLAITSTAARKRKNGHGHASEREQQCREARHPVFIVPGVLGSDLDVRFMGSGAHHSAPCSMRRPTKLTLWPPFSPDLLRNSACFMYLLQPVPCDTSHHRLRLCNNAGVSMFVNPGGEAGTETFAFQQVYAPLLTFLTEQFGYTIGKDLFATPYDWRLTLPTLEESGQFDFIAKRVESAVRKNCGKKAIIMGHSMGALVALGLMQSPGFEKWRQNNVQSYVSLGPPYGGSTYAVASKLGGSKWNLLAFIGDLLQPIINELVYQGSRGLPSILMLMPNTRLWGKDFVVVHTPRHNYTLGDLPDLFKATGDMQAVELYEHAQIMGNLMGKGPVPGVDTFCIYGAHMPTVQSWRYKTIVQGRPAPVGSADAAQMGLGDGVVNLESMRLCNKLTDSSRIHELGPGVDHGSVLSHPEALAALKAVLTQIVGGEQPLGAGGGSSDAGDGEGEDAEGSEQPGSSSEDAADGQQQQQQQQHGGTREVKAAIAGIELSWGGSLGLPQSSIKILG